MKSLSDQIIREKYTACVFISPHLDDAALSAGNLMTDLVNEHIRVTVINVFTGMPDIRPSLSVKQNLKQSGFPSMKTLYNARIDEDEKALHTIGVRNVNLGFTEALLRQKPSGMLARFIPELSYVYPTYRFHIARGRISRLDADLTERISEALRPYGQSKTLIFCPFGTGNHVDHLIVRRAVELITQPVYWLDQPYLYRSGNAQSTEIPKDYTLMKNPVDYTGKKQLISMYNTQVPALFAGSAIPHLDEYVIVQTNLL